MLKDFVFIGDSVTDCHRKRAKRFQQTQAALGQGYVKLLAQGALKAHRVWNRGYAGYKTSDTLREPDSWPEEVNESYCTTLLIGINDIWHNLKQHNEVDIDHSVMHFNRILDLMVAQSEHCIVMEPFALPFGAVDKSWFPVMSSLFSEYKRLCIERDIVWLPLQRKLEEQNNPEHYLEDGVHPTLKGHQWIAQQWLARAAPAILTS